MRYFKFGLAILFCLSAVFVGLNNPTLVTAQDDDTQIEIFTIEHNDYNYDTQVFIPSAYEVDGDPVPLVIAFHPAGGSGEQMAQMTEFDILAEEDNVLVAYPTSQFGYWNYGVGLPEWDNIDDVLDDLGFAEKLYDYLLENYNVDVARVYTVGHSNGSWMVMRLTCEHPDWFAGVAIAAAGMTSEVADACPKDVQMPVLYQHGTDDPLVPWDGRPRMADGEIISYFYAAPDTATYWALRNGCDLDPTILNPTDLNTNDRVNIRLARFDNCTSGKPVEFYAVINGGHSWLSSPNALPIDYQPSGNTSAFVWEFFQLYEE